MPSLSSLIAFIEKTSLNLLFPLSCLNCQREGFLVCNECLKKVKINTEQFCPHCEKKKIPAGKLCLDCKDADDFFLEQMVVAASYKNELLARMVHTFKYRFIPDLAQPLGEILVKSLQQSSLPLPDYLIPIPLHPRRLRWRGFNQSELLANYLSTNLAPGIQIPVLKNLLIRARFTQSQMKIKNYHERQKNLENAFAVNPGAKISLQGKKLLLVDDICTTGSTLNQCAKALKTLHPYSLSAVVLARQSS